MSWDNQAPYPDDDWLRYDYETRNQQMKISNAFPSKYLRAADLQDRNVKLVMARVEMEVIAGDDKKPVLYFTKAAKGLVLNKVNSKVIANAYGDDTDNWEGKEVILYQAMVDYRGDMVEAIRVRVPKPAEPPKPAPQTVDELDPPFNDDPPF